MQAFYVFLVSLLLTFNSRGEATGSVFFIDGSNNQFLRPRSEALPMSLSEISAAVSALLGFAPPATLTADGSSKLNKILKPNPFERPHAAFVLEIAGADALAETYPSHSFFGNAVRGSIYSDSYKADIELPESEVAVVSVNEHTSDVSDKDINEFASWLGGSYVAGSAEPLTGLLSIPLVGGANVEFHLEKEAEREFALNLLNLYQNVRRSVDLHEDLSHGIERPAELTFGRFGGIDALAKEYGQVMAKQGMDVLLATLSKLFDLLETSHKGQIVGVVVLDERVNQESANLLTVGSSSRTSARSMAELEGGVSPIIIAQVILVRLTLAWLTGIIFLIATFLGVYYLMYMPLTKDTLLYSNVKLD